MKFLTPIFILKITRQADKHLGFVLLIPVLLILVLLIHIYLQQGGGGSKGEMKAKA
jgi:hypothetical protein